MRIKVLIVEDDPRLGASLSRVMAEESFVVDLCATGREGSERARAASFDIIILDWMLPDMEGLSVCKELRAGGCETPILMLTVRSALGDRVLGLRSGADDYLCKPFEVEELLARMDALVRRELRGSFRIGALEVDRVSRRVALEGARIGLTTREFDLLVCLASRMGRPVSRTELLAEIWSTNREPGTSVIEVHMNRLRNKLGVYAEAIETVRGAGYRLNLSFEP